MAAGGIVTGMNPMSLAGRAVMVTGASSGIGRATSVALSQERTLEQDPMYAFRIIVDIASKALSPAINDPTTAVLAIDQIHHLLRDVGGRYLAEGPSGLRDRSSALSSAGASSSRV